MQSMKKYLVRISTFIPIIALWILTIFLVIYLSVNYLPWHESFPYYTDISHYGRYFATLAHFDGIHYLRLIQQGYQDIGSQAFFPVYPLVIQTLTFGYFDPLATAIFINISLVVGSLYLVGLSLPKNIVLKFALLLLSFPTSFYLLCNYTESLFIFLVLLFFNLLSRGKYLSASLVAGLASGTRLVGVFLAISLAIEMYKSRQSTWKIISLVMIALLGISSYIYYLAFRFEDPLMFVHVQTMFGAGRSGGEIILLPQVIYRYLKIFITVSPLSILYIRALWEFGLFCISLFVLYFYRRIISLPVLTFCLLCVLLPTLSGTLSSIPRYLLVIIPLLSGLTANISAKYFWGLLTFQYVMLIIVLAIFTQGIFVA